MGILDSIGWGSSTAKTSAVSHGNRAAEANRALKYYHSVTYQEQDLTTRYQSMYAKKPERWVPRKKTVYNLTRAVADALSTLYSDPVVRRWSDDDSANDAWQAWQPDYLQSIMARVDAETFLTGMTAVRPFPVVVNDRFERIDLLVFAGGQVEPESSSGSARDLTALSVSWEEQREKGAITVKQRWTGEQCVTYENDKAVKTEPNTYGFIPFVLFYNDLPVRGVVDYPATDLVEANLALNKLATDLNYTVAFQSAALLVTTGGKDTDSEVGPSARMNLPIGASANFINPGADIAGIVNAINVNLNLFFSSRRIPETAIVASARDRSGVAIVAEQESLRDYRRRRVVSFRPAEQELCRMAMRIAGYHQTGTLPEVDLPSITYRELTPPMAQDERDAWDWKVRNGLASPVAILMASDPTLTEDAARAIYQTNMGERMRAQASLFPALHAMPEEAVEAGE